MSNCQACICEDCGHNDQRTCDIDGAYTCKNCEEPTERCVDYCRRD